MNHEIANGWYLKSAEQGNRDAQYELGIMFYSGFTIEQSYENSFYWFRKGAENGLADGQAAVALCYKRGRGTPRDEEQTAHWFDLSARQGNAMTHYYLSLKLIDVEGIAQNYVSAFYRMERSASKNYPEAQYELAQMHRDGIGTEPDLERTLYWILMAVKNKEERAMKLYLDTTGLQKNMKLLDDYLSDRLEARSDTL